MVSVEKNKINAGEPLKKSKFLLYDGTQMETKGRRGVLVMAEGKVKFINYKCMMKECQESEGYEHVNVVYGDFTSSWPGVHRAISVAYRLVELGGELTTGEMNSYRYLIGQANEEQKALLFERFGGKLPFLFQ